MAMMQVEPGKVAFKITEKGGISVYGLGKMPVTLYRKQMERLLDAEPAIRKLIADNASKLADK